MPDCLQDYARRQIRLGRRVLEPGTDKGVAALLTAAAWVVQRLPAQVVEGRAAS
jgi:hypothetical protein